MENEYSQEETNERKLNSRRAVTILETRFGRDTIAVYYTKLWKENKERVQLFIK